MQDEREWTLADEEGTCFRGCCVKRGREGEMLSSPLPPPACVGGSQQ